MMDIISTTGTSTINTTTETYKKHTRVLSPHTESETTAKLYWIYWQARFRKSQSDLLEDYVCPVEERHMDLILDDATSWSAKQQSQKYVGRSYMAYPSKKQPPIKKANKKCRQLMGRYGAAPTRRSLRASIGSSLTDGNGCLDIYMHLSTICDAVAIW
jgi:hypothetical protein